MSRKPESLSHHPAPQAEKISSWMAFFMVFGGPAAWFVQLCIGSVMASWPCFPNMHRLDEPLHGYQWTRGGAAILLVVAALVAALAAWTSWRKLQQVRGEREGGHRELSEVGHGRTRFLALWGTITGVSFTIATLATLVAFVWMPRCAG
ncbi:hypothetical protein [Stakelama saccharophila]|uniref:Cytochrome c oxidase subunit I n=1 Tax=Stakelama saccharophila TaxID=3075605 RepID=A0ABZ0B5N1_9SPHN|nr:hypothetical protein [Stakelama sp. W311]WNO52701.1 hypothetical protein RPR59_09510 [Stakelama sp. W311]